MKKIYTIALILLLLLTPTLTQASTLTSVNISQTVQADDALFAFFDVSDETGAPMAGLSSEDVTLSIGSMDFVPTVKTVAESELGVGYVFAVDISKSLTEKQFEGVREAISAWISGIGELDQAAVLTFGDEITMLTDFTADTAALQSIVQGIGPTDGNTQLYNGILRALDVAKRQSADLPLRRVLVILSDGMDDFPAGATMTEVTEKAGESSVPIYVVGVKGRNNQDALNELGSVARLSGGDLYLTEQDELSAGYHTVYDRIQSGYVAGVVLDHTVADGSEQGLILSVKQGSVFVEDSVDVRLRAVAAPPTPEPTLAPTPRSTLAPTPSPVPEPKKPNPVILIIIGAVAAVGVLVFIVFSAKKRKARKLEQEKVDEIKRRQKLDELIDVKASKGKTNVDATHRLGADTAMLNDETVSLGQSQQRRVMISLEDVKSGGERRYTAQLKNALIVGRKAEETDIVIQDRSISGKHCRFEMQNERLYLKDLNSTNGTYLLVRKQKQRVGSEGAVIKNGDSILLGETELAVTIYED